MTFLNKIIEPVLIGDFMNTYWNKSYLKVDGTKDKYAQILSLKIFQSLLKNNSDFLAFPQVTLFQDTERVNENKYSKKWRLRVSAILGIQEKSSIDIAKINSFIQKGVTIKISQLESVYPSLIKFLNNFSKEINPESIYANALYSTKTTHGFVPHFDEHDGFVLQLHGEKVWELYESFGDNPLQEYKNVYTDDITKAKKVEIKLKEGDFLYVPRGMWHNVYTLDHSSLHLQIGVRSKTPIDLIYWVQEKLIEQSDFRRALVSSNRIDHETKSLILNSIKAILDDDKGLELFFDTQKGNKPYKAEINIE